MSRHDDTRSIHDKPDNLVFLRGRLADEPTERDLPSGDVLMAFRLTVDRPKGERVRVDSLECVTTKAAVRRKLRTAQVGDGIEVTGSLRRRFWRSPGGPASRYSVDVSVVRVSRAGRRVVAGPTRTPASA